MSLDLEVATTSKAAAQQEFRQAARSFSALNIGGTNKEPQEVTVVSDSKDTNTDKTENYSGSAGSSNTNIESDHSGSTNSSSCNRAADINNEDRKPSSSSGKINCSDETSNLHVTESLKAKSDAISGKESLSSSTSSSSSVSSNICDDTKTKATIFTTATTSTTTTTTRSSTASLRMQDSVENSSNSITDKNSVMTTNLDGTSASGGTAENTGADGMNSGGGDSTGNDSGSITTRGGATTNTTNDNSNGTGNGIRSNNGMDSTGHIENGSNTTTNGHDLKQNGVHVNNENKNNNTAASSACEEQNNHDVAKTIAWLGKTNQEIIRLIGQYLQDLGLESSVKTLMKESGCYLEHPSATKFREHVLSGEWKKADSDLKELESLIENGKPSTITEMKFLLLEQKYLEYLDDGCSLDALSVLRNELTPLQYNTSRVHQLSSYMMCSNNHDLYQRSKWEGKGILSRALVMERLQAFLPPSVMMSPRRLRALLQQAVELQAERCPCHDMAWETNLQNVSLLTDHCCTTEGFPMQTIQILTEHCDEVWFCKFSPDGLKLATGSKDAIVIIWDVDPYKLQLKQRRIIDSRFQMSVAFISWSPDSKLVLVGGPEDSSEVCIFNVDDGRLVLKMSHNIQEDSFSCGAFNRDGTRFVCGGQKGQFYLCDLKATILDSWEGVRINSVAFRSDNKTILAADSHYRIRGYNFDNPRSDFDILKETHPIMTFTINSADRLALLNISNQGLHLWDIEDKCLIRRFQGIRQSNFAIHSCFGGVNESFVASGSEDKNVVIWHIKREDPLAKLSGHTKTVNCVSWNPVYPSLLASASDDATVRIWGPNSFQHVNATPESDDCSSCSSSSSWNMTSYSH